ncbi:MAG TPA: tetratricopeptide repeat protein, partial [Candidatus Caenarcaniphilales bacterium]
MNYTHKAINFLGIAAILGGGLTGGAPVVQAQPMEETAALAARTRTQNFFKQGLEKFKQADYQGAIADWNQELRRNPNFFEVYYNRGLARYQLGDKQGAIEDYTRALQLNPDDADSYINRGLARAELGNYQA